MTDSNQEFNELKAELLSHLQKSLHQEPEFDQDGGFEKSYSFDDMCYVIQNGAVFKLVDKDEYVYTDEVTPSQLEIYGMELIDNSVIIELNVLAIKEKENGSALITGEDGSGLEIVLRIKNILSGSPPIQLAKSVRIIYLQMYLIVKFQMIMPREFV